MFMQIQLTAAASRKKDAILSGKPVDVDEKPKALILDMPIRWSSTFLMLLRAFNLRTVSLNSDNLNSL